MSVPRFPSMNMNCVCSVYQSITISQLCRGVSSKCHRTGHGISEGQFESTNPGPGPVGHSIFYPHTPNFIVTGFVPRL